MTLDQGIPARQVFDEIVSLAGEIASRQVIPGSAYEDGTTALVEEVQRAAQAILADAEAIFDTRSDDPGIAHDILVNLLTALKGSDLEIASYLNTSIEAAEGRTWTFPPDHELSDPVRLPLPQARAQLDQTLQAWQPVPETATYVQADPGLGKSRALHELAVRQQQAGKFVVVSMFTLENIEGTGDDMLPARIAETVRRLNIMSTRSSYLPAPGRNEDSCTGIVQIRGKPVPSHDVVTQVSAKGQMPGSVVCRQCNLWPATLRDLGMDVLPNTCGYWRARTMIGAARQKAKWRPLIYTPPIVGVTHAGAAAFTDADHGIGTPDVVITDEDCTGALETELVLDHDTLQASTGDFAATSLFAAILRTACAAAKEQRNQVAGMRAWNRTHTYYSTCLASRELHTLLADAFQLVGGPARYPNLEYLLEEVRGEIPSTDTTKVYLQAGLLDLLPSASFAALADVLRSELGFAHHLTVRAKRSAAEQGAFKKLVEKSDLSYACRLESNGEGGQRHSDWQFVVRTQRSMPWPQAAHLYGDAYANKAHVDHMFKQQVHLVEARAELPDTVKVWWHPSNEFSKKHLEEHGMARVQKIIEDHLTQHAQPGDSALIYMHKDLIPKLQIPDGVRILWDLDDIAFEHWWGGRGKDRYKGVKFTFAVSAPIANLGAMAHTANARRFWKTQEAIATGTLDKTFPTERIILPPASKNGVRSITEVADTDPELRDEVYRLCTSELIQGAFRGRLYDSQYGEQHLVVCGPIRPPRNPFAYITVVSEVETEVYKERIGTIVDELGIYCMTTMAGAVALPASVSTKEVAQAARELGAGWHSGSRRQVLPASLQKLHRLLYRFHGLINIDKWHSRSMPKVHGVPLHYDLRLTPREALDRFREYCEANRIQWGAPW